MMQAQPNTKAKKSPAAYDDQVNGDPMLAALKGPQAGQTSQEPDTLPGEGGGGPGMPAQPRRTPDLPVNTGAYLPPAAYQPNPLVNTGMPSAYSSSGGQQAPGVQANAQGAYGQDSDPLPVDRGGLPIAGPKANGGITVGGEGNYPDFSQPGVVEQWWRERGVELRPGAGDTWRQYWQQYGRSNPEYFGRKLNEALQSGSELGDTDRTPGAQGGGGQYSTPGWQRDPAIHDAILRMLKRGETPVSGDDPAIRAQFQPQSQVIQRNNARSRASAAERAFAQGQTGEGAIDTDVNAINQQSGLDEANLMGKLIGDELTARRQEVVQALQLANDQDKMALQEYLARIDAELRRYGIDTSNRQFYDDLGYRIGSREYDYNQHLLDLLQQG